jgi:predicted MFS family arabinose efflux permease
VLLLCAGLFLSAAAAGEQLALAALALILASGAANAGASLVLSAWPLVLGSSRTTSSLAGLLGFAFNIGGGFSGSATGMILDYQGWSAVFGVLALTALVGAGASLFLHTQRSD